jgi:murein L,D-transpeptidase YcbB/YkuD
MKTPATTRKPILLLLGFCLIMQAFVGTQAFAGDGGIGSLQSQSALLQNALTKYTDIQTRGGWDKVKLSKKFYNKGDSGPAIKQLKDRLRASGDFTIADTSSVYTNELFEVVKKVQLQFGFKDNGVIDAAFVKELNVPVEKRIAQLQLNMERFSKLPAVTQGTRLVANIPEFKLHIYEGDQRVFDIDVVVGKESTKTVVFNDEMQHIVFSPSWTVPPSIVKNEILPAMRKRREYLWKNNYVQTGTENGLPVIKQLPGPGNALGKVKFVFPNSHSIYFHDTPAKSLFSLRKRAFSHGCIRLAEPAKLAEYLLRNNPEWTTERITKAMNSGKEQYVKLSETVPVSISYFTAWVDNSGVVNFREDIYGMDK